MIELPEAVTLVGQLNENAKGKRISGVIAASSPHKFAWYSGDPQEYSSKLNGKVMGPAQSHGGMVESNVHDMVLILAEGVGLRFHVDESSYPKKHQLFISFEDSTALSVSIQMYGGIWCCEEGAFDNPYYAQAKQKPSPLSDEFSEKYFDAMIIAENLQNKRVKELCATEQRIPGLGNGVLQDILFTARLHPKRKLDTLTASLKSDLYRSVRDVLREMVSKGGRDTEKDLSGNYGGYRTAFCKKTVGTPCPGCGAPIIKENYLGGSVYYCSACQMP